VKKLLVLIFVCLLGCENERVAVVSHWHWEAISKVVRRTTVPDESECDEVPNGAAIIRRSERINGTVQCGTILVGRVPVPQYCPRVTEFCVYLKIVDRSVREEHAEGMDRAMVPPTITVGPGETRTTSGSCFIAFRWPGSGNASAMIPVPCDSMLNYPIGSSWIHRGELTATNQLTRIQ